MNFDPTKPITKEEEKWAKRLEKLMSKVPDRFGLYISGDYHITAFDKNAVVGDIQDGNMSLQKEVLIIIDTTEAIHGLAM